MSSMLAYTCLVLAVVSIIMMLDIKEDIKNKRVTVKYLCIHVVLMISMIIIMWNIIDSI